MKKIVILGAGFGGLRAATVISKKLKSLNLLQKYEVVLIDRNDYHIYTPLLYEVATTSKKTADLSELHTVATCDLAQLTQNLSLNFIQGEVTAIDFSEGKINLAGGQVISCDYAIFALGSETNHFNIKGLKENSLPFKTFTDATAIRDAVLNFFESGPPEAKLAKSGNNKLNIIIGGGGSTGIELAGELKMCQGELAAEYGQCRIGVTIIEAAPTILPGFSSKIVEIVKKRLRFLGVNIIEGEIVEAVRKNELTLRSAKKLPFDLFVWAGGVRAPLILAGGPLKTEVRGRIEVVEGMECLPKTPDLKIYPRVYAIGDNTCIYDLRTGKPMPGVARAAIEEADIAAHNLIEELKAETTENYKPKTKNYAPKEYPYVIPVGGKFAVAKLGPIIISGFLGWLLKGLVELNYLISIMPIRKALALWLKGLKIFIQNDRLG